MPAHPGASFTGDAGSLTSRPAGLLRRALQGRAAYPVSGHGVVNHAALAAVLDQFAGTVTADFAADDVLRRLAEGAMQVLDIDGAGVMAPRDGHLLRFVFATSEPVGGIERLQEVLQSGPCRDAYHSGQVVHAADLLDQGDDWPEYQAHAVEIGLRAVAALPLRARGETWGVLDLYRAAPRGLDDAELAAAQTLANLATSYLVVTADRDTAQRAQTELAHRAMHDPLTGLPVRWVFLEQLTRALARLRRHPGHLAVLFLDLDGLKYINDTHGHLAGDLLIQTCVQRVRAALRPTDLVARIGGDEFVILLEEISGPTEAAAVAGRILEHLAARDQPHGQAITPSGSIGVAVTADPNAAEDTLITHADAAMYEAKDQGRARYQLFDPARYAANMAADGVREELSSGLLAALPGGELELHYQPILDLRHPAPGPHTDTPAWDVPAGVWAVEALARWRHPRRGLLAASDFIAAAERSSLITEIGAWAIHGACHQLAAWDSVLSARAPQQVFVNISVTELVNPALQRLVATALADSGLDPSRLTLEITETGLFTEPRAAVAAVGTLRELGCGLAIDDFGTGYSSLSRLVQIPATTLKIDQSFTRGVTANPDAAAVITAVLQLGRTLQRTVIVEGVENQPTLNALRQLGATHAQGFHLGLPQDCETITTSLKG